MHFSWLNKQGVASDQGFVVQRVERFAYEYREGERVMRLDGESIYGNLGNASFGFGFHPGWRAAKWQAPFDAQDILAGDRDRIVQNIKAAFDFMGGKAEFD